ncbi:isopeptide-forming domain-containing fimbrial protein [Curtobacterium luteum]|uniref:DUF11 domain-containing protein n=1 Tax=Curtobacterium luteum TaxID=33881 RepID=A0A175S0D3_9MICO|nr:isopeptide-forming domain-containing fimbrial protein [Curtobacterium luteum]KTR09282.1 hypothetical protein NS184_03170 [Curtobacterium luteum]
MLPTLLSVRPRALAMLVVTTLLAGLLAVVAFAQPVAAAAASAMTVAVKADGSVLNGEQASVTITAKNPAGAPALYNLGYTYTLPVGVTYVASSAGIAVGEPVISDVTDSKGAVVGTLLTWANVSDLVSGDAKSITFEVRSADEVFPVGSRFTGTAQVAANTIARTVPTFDADGAPADGYTDQAKSELASTAVSALKIVKSEPSSEHELVRGVHAQPTTYTLTVANTKQAPTNGVTVTDYLPAGLEFLQCGNVEHTTSGAEYDGAPALGTATKLADCTDPVSVETVLGAPGQDDTKVFTKVVWNLGDLAAGAKRTISYRAAVPLHENTMDFSGQPGKPATAAEPTAESLGQGANLDNNNGPSTRQDTSDPVSNGQAQKNTAVASGSYQGRDADGTSGSVQTAQDSLTVEAMDLAVAKAVSPTTFTAGKLAGYTLTIRAGEYERAEGISFTDEIPNGICPVVPADTALQVDGDGAYPSDCDPRSVSTMAGAVRGATVDSVTYHPATGGFTMAMTLATTDATDPSGAPRDAAMPKNTTQEITYAGLMRSTYSATQQQGPTAVGDAFTNTVQMSGTSVGVAGDTGSQRVVDDSRATITSTGPTISKQVLSRAATQGVTNATDCAARTDGYSAKDAGGFTLGDTVCFRLEVQFGAGAQTRNATVTDMLPNGTATGAGWKQDEDWALGGSSSGNTVAAEDVAVSGDTTSTTATFSIGHPVAGATGTYLPQNGEKTTLVFFVAAKIGAPGSSTAKADLTQNLMKYAQQDTEGSVTSLRTMANYAVSGDPAAAIAKTITAVGATADSMSAVSKPSQATEGQYLRYAVTVTNDAAGGSSLAMDTVTVRDALPPGVTCAEVPKDDVSDDGRCVAAPDDAPTSLRDRAFIVWRVAAPLAADASRTLTYAMRMPAQASAGSTYENRASVTAFTTTTTGGDTTTWIPAPTDRSTSTTSAGSGQRAATSADAAYAVTVPAATVDKTGAAEAGATNLSDRSVAPGQNATFTYSVTVPARTTVLNGVLADPIADGLAITDATSWTLGLPGDDSAATVGGQAGSADATASYTMPDGSDATFTLTGRGDPDHGPGTILFPTTFDNSGSTDLVFTVTVAHLRVTKGTSSKPQSGASRFRTGTVTNTATFTNDDPLSGSRRSASKPASLAVTAPNVTVTKRNSLPSNTKIAGGDSFTWTVTAKNDTTGVDARSVIIVDCYPDAFTYDSSTSEYPLTDAMRAKLQPCGTGTTLHAWRATGDGTLAGGASASVTITAKAKTDLPAGASYTNSAQVLSSSIDTDYTDATPSYIQREQTTNDVSVTGPTITKQLQSSTWDPTSGASTGTRSSDATKSTTTDVRVGDRATYSIVATIPANVALYHAQVTDELPTGLTASGAPSAVVSGSSAQVTSVQESGGTVTVQLADITSASGSAQPTTVTITVPVTVDADRNAGDVLKNTATLAWNRTDEDTTPQDASTTSYEANVSVVRPALAIAKTATVGSVESTAVKAEPGQPITYSVTITNTGSPAYGVPVTDCVPAGIVVDEASLTAENATLSRDASCGGGRISWPSTTVGTNATVTHTYAAKLADDASLTGGALVNTASTGDYQALPDGQRYQGKNASATVTPSFPKVSVSKSNDTVGGLSYIGQPSDFSVTFRNDGSTTPKVTAQDVLPENWSYVPGSATTSRDGAAATAAPTPKIDGRTLTWSDLGSLGQSSTLVLHYQATPQADVVTTPGVGVGTGHVNHVTATAASATGATGSGSGSYVWYPKGGDDATATATIGSADLAVTKKATDARVIAGATTPKAWTITVTNRGPDAAHGTTVIDRPKNLPEGATLAFSTADPKATQWQCTPKDSTWACVNGAVVEAGNAFPELVVALTLPADADLGTITNTATITQAQGQTYDPNSANDSDSDTLTPIAQADLAITKTSNTAEAKAGRSISWTLTVQNLRDEAAHDVSDARGPITVHDDLPDTVTAVSASGDGWTCSVQDDAVDCTRTGLPSGAVSAITVLATVHPDVTADQTIKNSATVSVDPDRTTDPTPGNDTSEEVSTPVDDSITLTIAKAFDGSLVAGSPAHWTITVTNTGTADARKVQVTDALESGTELDGSGAQTDGGWTCDAPTDSRNRVTCDLDGTLAAGKSTTFTLTVSTPSSLQGRIDNTAVVTADNAITQSALANSDATQTAGLSVTKTADVREVDAGRDVTYTITVANPDGPSDLPAGDATTPSVRVQDTLPAGVEFVGLDAATAQHWTLESNTDRVVTLTSTAGIAAGATDPNTIVLTVHVPASTSAGDLVNTVTAAPVTAKGATAQDDATVTVTTHAGLSIVKERTSAPTADAGTEVTYDVTVHNDGPSDAQDAVWSDTAQTGMTVTKVTTDADSWEQGADVTTWSTDTFAAGETAVFHVTAAIASGTPAGTLRNVAAVSSATSDPDGDDDRSGADVEVTTHASLGLTKTPVAAVGKTTAVKTVTAGTDQVWLLQVHNAGPSDAQPTTVVTDDLPAGLTFRSGTGAGWSCDATTTPGAVVCDLSSTVVAGQDAPALWLTTAVASGYTSDALVNTARVTGSGTPATPGTNGSAESPITVGRTANVAIAIGHTGTAVIGKDLPETIQVRNDGSSDAAAVTATYTLPKGLTYVSAEADPRWTVASVEEHADGTTTVTFTLDGPLVAGTLAPVITVHQIVTVDAYPGVEPTATVATTTRETTTEDNDDVDETAVAPASALSVTKTHTGAVVRGKTVGYTVTVRNDGLTEDPGPVVVTDRLPAGLTLVSVDDGGAATCTDGRTVSCTLTEPLSVDSAVAFQITVRVADDAPDRITNTASVSTPTLQSESSAQTVRPGDPTRASDPATVSGHPRGDLAFTGAAGLGIGALLALLAMATGGVLLVLRRRRRA